MPARTLNDFFAGIFYGQAKEGLEPDRAIKAQNDTRKVTEGRVIAEKVGNI